MLDPSCDASADSDMIRSQHGRGGSITCDGAAAIFRVLAHGGQNGDVPPSPP